MHECPECGMPCRCNGDIDDIPFENPPRGCRHVIDEKCDEPFGRYDPDDADVEEYIREYNEDTPC